MTDEQNPGSQQELSVIKSLQQLEDIFLDERRPHGQRQEAFLGYWLTRTHEELMISRSDWARVLQFPQWPYAINELVRRACHGRRISIEDARWLVDELPAESHFGRDQLSALITLTDGGLAWQERLARLLMLRADWAAVQVLESVSDGERDEAREIVCNSSRPRRARNALLRLLEAH